MSTRAYAQGTKTDSLASQAEILRILHRAGVTQHGFGSHDDQSFVMFAYGGLTYRISIIMPRPDHESFLYSEQGRQRTDSAAKNAYDSEVRRRWRSLVLLIKAKLVAIEDGITEFEEEFLPYAVTDTGQTVSQRMVPQLKQAALEGRVPSALPFPGGKGCG